MAQSASAGSGPSARSPACDAAKIRCRSRRTCSSWPQSTWSQSGKPSSGPFTAGPATGALPRPAYVPSSASNLPFGSGVRPLCLRRLTRPASAPFRAGHPPLSGQLCGSRWRRSQHLRSRFPAAFRPPAFASRVILPRRGFRLSYGRPTGRAAGRTPSGLSMFRMREIRPGWAPSVPRGRRCAPGQSVTPSRHLPPSSGRSLSPACRIPPAGCHS